MSTVGKKVDPVAAARARLGVASRGQGGLTIEQARKELALAKLTRHIAEVIEEHDLDDAEVASLCERLAG